MASRRNQRRYSNQSAPVDSSFERSIGSLTSAVQTLTDAMNNKPNPQTPKPSQKSKAESEFEDQIGDIGKKMFNGIESMFGKKAAKNLKDKMIANQGASMKGIGKNLLGGGFKAAGGGMAGLAGSAMKALGPIGAVYTGVKAVFDFINSGEAAKAAANFGAIFDVDTSEMTKDLYMASEEYRKQMADYNVMTPIRLNNQARMDGLNEAKAAEMDLLGFQQSKVKDVYEYETGLMRDKITFAQDQASQQLDADLARRKALYVSDMGYMQKALHIGERALQAIGSSTQAVLEAVKNVGVSLGTSLKNQVSMATSAAGLGAMYMSSADEVLGMSKTFRLMDKSSADQALNMTAGLKSFARMNDMEPAQLFKEMADSQEEIFKYTNYTSQEFARQVVMLKNMNTSMASMAKASDTMVLNYKDSMKAEMGLSAMLGKNVDLSETRARLMSGDMAGGASALKSALGGIDINSMNPFAKQQLSQATGMGIDELMNLMSGKGGGAKGSLEQENAKKTGASIANGALQQDISNAAAKLALDQKNRKELLEFEQVIRKNSLMIEQAQRLQNLAVEQKFRLKTAKLETEGQIDEAVGKMQAEAASGFFANLFGNQKGLGMQDLKGTGGMKPADVKTMLAGFEAEKQGLINAASAGALKADDPRLAQYAAQMAKFDLSKNIKDFPKAVDYFGDSIKTEIAKLQGANGKGGALANTKAQVKKAEAFKEEEGGWWNKLKGITAMGVGLSTMNPAIIQAGMSKVTSAKAADLSLEQAKKDLENQKGQLAQLQDANKWLTQDAASMEALKTTNSGQNALLMKQNNTMIGLLSTGLLYQQATAEASEKPITINGRVLNKSLLNQNSTSYGLGTTPGLFSTK